MSTLPASFLSGLITMGFIIAALFFFRQVVRAHNSTWLIANQVR